MTANAATQLLPASIEIDGARLRLREIVETDANDTYVGWMNDPETVRYTESRFVRHTLEGVRRYITALRAERQSLFLAIVVKESDRHIGNIKLGPIDWKHGSGDIGLLIGERDCWGKGFASEAISILADYAFDAIGLAKLTAGVYAPNVGCIRAFERAGFVREGLRRRQYRFEDGRVDAVLMGRVRRDAE